MRLPPWTSRGRRPPILLSCAGGKKSSRVAHFGSMAANISTYVLLLNHEQWGDGVDGLWVQQHKKRRPVPRRWRARAQASQLDQALCGRNPSKLNQTFVCKPPRHQSSFVRWIAALNQRASPCERGQPALVSAEKQQLYPQARLPAQLYRPACRLAQHAAQAQVGRYTHHGKA